MGYNKMHQIKSFLNPAKIAFMALNLAFSAFLYGNVVEKAFLVDLPYVDSVATTQLPAQITKNEENLLMTKNKRILEGYFGTPQTLRIPKLKATLDLDAPVLNSEGWKISNTKAYVWTYTENKSGLIGNSLVFANTEYIPMNIITLVSEGDRIVLQTNKNWNYTYKVTKKHVIDSKEEPVITKGTPTKLVVVKELGEKKGLMVLEADFSSIEEEI